MGVSLELSVASVVIEVGGEASLDVTVRNTGSVIDEASLSLLGPSAAWSVVEPGTLSLLPGSEGTAKVTFRPPRSASIPAGRTPFGVMAASREDPDGSSVEEGTIEITRLVDVAAELNPRTSRGQREGTHDLTVTNRGNAPITVEVAANDPGDLLYLSVTPPQLIIQPGGTGTARIVAQARWELEQGNPQTIPFKVTVTPEGEAATTIDGALMQEPKEKPPEPVETSAAAPAPAQAPPAPPPPAKPSQLPKILAGLLALLVMSGVVVAAATGKLPGVGGKKEAAATTVPATTAAPATSAPDTSEQAGADPQDFIPDIKASRTAGPTQDGNGDQITFEAENMIDGDEGTAWRAPGDGAGITITLTYPQPVRIRQIGLIPGWALKDPNNGEDRFAENRTIDSVSWRFRPQGAAPQSFEQKPELQVTDVDVVANSITLRILKTLPPQQGDRQFTAISEIAVR